MRAYFFGNMYLSAIQQGIQAAHVVGDMSIKYWGDNVFGEDTNSPAGTFYNWANFHKTMVLLNGGYSENLHELVSRFGQSENPYAWEHFNEGQDALDGALTCVGIVLPEKIYEGGALIRKTPFRDREYLLKGIQDTGTIELEGGVHFLSKWEFDFMQELNNYGLAR